jgi:hypothetical protein
MINAALQFAEKLWFWGGAAVYRCDKSFVLIRASAHEVRPADFVSKLFSRCGVDASAAPKGAS